jgi:hypothetical protein
MRPWKLQPANTGKLRILLLLHSARGWTPARATGRNGRGDILDMECEAGARPRTLLILVGNSIPLNLAPMNTGAC